MDRVSPLPVFDSRGSPSRPAWPLAMPNDDDDAAQWGCLSAYELERQRNVERNRLVLRSLGIEPLTTLTAQLPRRSKKRSRFQVAVEERRQSMRTVKPPTWHFAYDQTEQVRSAFTGWEWYSSSPEPDCHPQTAVERALMPWSPYTTDHHHGRSRRMS